MFSWATSGTSDISMCNFQVDQVDWQRQKPEWLHGFLQKTFFDSCSVHQIRRNEMNKYCIDCNASICQFCVTLGAHQQHKLLKIYRHVYKDVVPLDEIEQYLDCTKIQPYRCNRQMVIALTPLPHCGSKPDDEATCEICRRRLVDANLYTYCSISCKVEAFSRKSDDSAAPFLLLQTQEMEKAEQDSKPEKKPMQDPKPEKNPIHRRKGVPRRAPLF
ncbi:hypothetical protein Nepgr_021166 [Nepenthes gracilis]|uniref:B box-type domain-containing protein n=1 Tax=Nepenthes gracilis TaxID=150966 RepID=A0AAD3SWS0_NEPGR|nr:hypothetical protein Nepgr_021166 [Nepenthes gracilis]